MKKRRGYYCRVCGRVLANGSRARQRLWLRCVQSDAGGRRRADGRAQDELLAPARGEELIARGRVVRAGRTLTVCQADASMLANGAETSVAITLATIMTVRDRPGVVG